MAFRHWWANQVPVQPFARDETHDAEACVLLACTLHKLVSQLLNNSFPSRDGGVGWGVRGGWLEGEARDRERDRQTDR